MAKGGQATVGLKARRDRSPSTTTRFRPSCAWQTPIQEPGQWAVDAANPLRQDTGRSRGRSEALKSVDDGQVFAQRVVGLWWEMERVPGKSNYDHIQYGSCGKLQWGPGESPAVESLERPGPGLRRPTAALPGQAGSRASGNCGGRANNDVILPWFRRPNDTAMESLLQSSPDVRSHEK